MLGNLLPINFAYAISFTMSFKFSLIIIIDFGDLGTSSLFVLSEF